MPRLCEFYTGICLTTEEKARRNLSQGKKNLSQSTQNNTYNNTNYNRKTQITTNLEECGPCSVFASFTLEFALQLKKKQGKTSVRVRKTSVRLRKTSVGVQYTYYQKGHTLQNLHRHTRPHITKPIHTHTHTHRPIPYKTKGESIPVVVFP